jgi:hypothetical protein
MPRCWRTSRSPCPRRKRGELRPRRTTDGQGLPHALRCATRSAWNPHGQNSRGAAGTAPFGANPKISRRSTAHAARKVRSERRRRRRVSDRPRCIAAAPQVFRLEARRSAPRGSRGRAGRRVACVGQCSRLLKRASVMPWTGSAERGPFSGPDEGPAPQSRASGRCAPVQSSTHWVSRTTHARASRSPQKTTSQSRRRRLLQLCDPW